MSDISMCQNKDCVLKDKCYRYRAEPNPYRQSYMGFKPRMDGSCKDFVAIEPGDRLRDDNKDILKDEDSNG